MPEQPTPDANWLLASALLIGAVLGGVILHLILFGIATRISGRTPSRLDNAVLRYARRPVLLLLPAAVLLFVIPLLPVPDPTPRILRHAVALILIAAGAWLLISASRVIDDALGVKFRIDQPDNMQARRVITQVRVLRGTLGVLIWVLAAAAMLMTFPGVRELGASLLASAGLAGIVVGFAARPVLSNVIAGVQIALAQPIRLDDVVIINGEFGRIEEIKTSFVVVRVWDLRRIIVPLTWFIENPFQNWTYNGAEIIGSAFLVVDYTVPVEELRQELRRIVEGSPHWDGKVCAMHVTEITEHGLQVRAIMSARDAGAAFDLRCVVRERLIDFVRQRYPHALRQVRVNLDGQRQPALEPQATPL